MAVERLGGKAGGGEALGELGLVGFAGLTGDIFAIHPGELLHIKARGGGLALGEVEGLDHLGAGHHFAVVARRPAEEGEVVEEGFGQVAQLAELADEGRAIALGVGLAGVVDDHRQMRVLRHRRADGLEELDVLEGVFHVVIAADDVGHALGDVVEDVGQVEDGRTIGADDDEVLRVLRLLLHVALDQVVILNHALLGHPEDDALALAALVLLVGIALGQQLLGHRQVVFALTGLVHHLAIIIQPQPRHALEQRLNRLRGRPLQIRVFHAEQKLAAHVPGIEPVENGRANVANVHLPRWRRRKTNPNLLCHKRNSFRKNARSIA